MKGRMWEVTRGDRDFPYLLSHLRKTDAECAVDVVGLCSTVGQTIIMISKRIFSSIGIQDNTANHLQNHID